MSIHLLSPADLVGHFFLLLRTTLVNGEMNFSLTINSGAVFKSMSFALNNQIFSSSCYFWYSIFFFSFFCQHLRHFVTNIAFYVKKSSHSLQFLFESEIL